MSSLDVELDVQALSYLVTVIIHRMQERDQTWWRELLEELEADRKSVLAGSTRDKVLRKAIGIVEQAMKPS